MAELRNKYRNGKFDVGTINSLGYQDVEIIFNPAFPSDNYGILGRVIDSSGGDTSFLYFSIWSKSPEKAILRIYNNGSSSVKDTTWYYQAGLID